LKLDYLALDQIRGSAYLSLSLATDIIFYSIAFIYIFALHLITSEINQLAGYTESDREII